MADFIAECRFNLLRPGNAHLKQGTVLPLVNTIEAEAKETLRFVEFIWHMFGIPHSALIY